MESRIQGILHNEDKRGELLEEIAMYRNLIANDKRFKGCVSIGEINVPDIPLNKDVSVKDSLCFEFKDKKGNVVRIVTVLGSDMKLREAAVIYPNAKLEVSKEYAEKVNSAEGREIVDFKERVYLKSDEDNKLQIDEDRIKAENEKDKAVKAINEKEGKPSEQDADSKNVIINTVEKGAAEPLLEVLGKSASGEVQLAKMPDGKWYVLDRQAGRIDVIAGASDSPIVVGIRNAIGSQNLPHGSTVKSGELEAVKTGGRGAKADALYARPGKTDKGGKPDLIKTDASKIENVNLEIATGGTKATIIGQQTYPIQDRQIIVNGQVVNIEQQITDEPSTYLPGVEPEVDEVTPLRLKDEKEKIATAKAGNRRGRHVTAADIRRQRDKGEGRSLADGLYDSDLRSTTE